MDDCGHKIIKCSKCGDIIAQCRCMSKNKAVEYITCGKCTGPSPGTALNTANNWKTIVAY